MDGDKTCTRLVGQFCVVIGQHFIRLIDWSHPNGLSAFLTHPFFLTHPLLLSMSIVPTHILSFHSLSTGDSCQKEHPAWGGPRLQTLPPSTFNHPEVVPQVQRTSGVPKTDLAHTWPPRSFYPVSSGQRRLPNQDMHSTVPFCSIPTPSGPIAAPHFEFDQAVTKWTSLQKFSQSTLKM